MPMSPATELLKLKKREQTLKKKLKQEHGAKGFPRQPLWMLVQAHLAAQSGGPASLESVLQAMLEAGHDLGRYPKRTIKNCVVSPHLSGFFELTVKGSTEMVGLRAASVVPYTPPGAVRPVQQTKRPARSA